MFNKFSKLREKAKDLKEKAKDRVDRVKVGLERAGENTRRIAEKVESATGVDRARAQLSAARSPMGGAGTAARLGKTVQVDISLTPR